MKKSLIICSILVLNTFIVISQVSEKQINGLVVALKANNKSESDIKNILNGIIKNPELYNTFWSNFLKQSYISENDKYKFLNDLNISFKTFQSKDSTKSSLGFAYNFNFDYAKYVEVDNHRISHSFGLSTKGNVAFNKNLNPNNFLETKINYSYSYFSGGVGAQTDSAYFSRLNEIEDKLVKINDMKSEEAIKLWDDFGSKLQLTNQYFYSFSPKVSYESNQDFSKTQFVPGINIDLGAKSWNDKETLSKLNLFDYPFALLRLITGTDKQFTTYGSTLPTVQLALDYVIPTKDSLRKAIVKNENPYPRFKFETSFRTFVSRFNSENIFFNADYRYYQELNPSKEISAANLSSVQYLVMSLQSTSGLFVSYATGKLPFDRKADQIYSIGFNYKFK
jgi:hypothetical protein